MIPYNLLRTFAGLSQSEAARFHDVRPDTVKSWCTGRNSAPLGAVAELRALIAMQDRAASEALAQIAASGPVDRIEIGYPTDDHEAEALGWPCVGAWQAMAARVLVSVPGAVFVPRGATVATAAADAGN